MSITATVPVPVKVTLRISHDHPGTPDRDATPADLTAFGYVSVAEIYRHLCRSVAAVATGDPDTDLTSEEHRDSTANAIRHLLETAMHYADTPEKVRDQLEENCRALLASPAPDAA